MNAWAPKRRKGKATLILADAMEGRGEAKGKKKTGNMEKGRNYKVNLVDSHQRKGGKALSSRWGMDQHQ